MVLLGALVNAACTPSVQRGATTPATPPKLNDSTLIRQVPILPLREHRTSYRVLSRTISTERAVSPPRIDSVVVQQPLTALVTLPDSSGALEIRLVADSVAEIRYPQSATATRMAPDTIRTPEVHVRIASTGAHEQLDPGILPCHNHPTLQSPLLAIVVARALLQASGRLLPADSVQYSACSGSIPSRYKVRFQEHPTQGVAPDTMQIRFNGSLQADSTSLLPMRIMGTFTGTVTSFITERLAALPSQLRIEIVLSLEFASQLKQQIIEQSTFLELRTRS